MENLIVPFPFRILRILENRIAQEGIARVIANMLIVTSFASGLGPTSLLLVCTRVHSLSWHSSSSTFSLKPFLASHETSFLLASWSEPKASFR